MDLAFQTKIAKSDAFASLEIEECAFDILRKCKWESTPNLYYKDLETDKSREADIVARRRYQIKANDFRNTRYIDLYILVECKSISSYHILFSNILNYNHETSLVNYWFGEEINNHYKNILPILTKHLPENEIEKIIKHIYRNCYPNEISAIHTAVPKLFQSIKHVAGFRETNTSNTKDLENSVLWKAFLQIHSLLDYMIKTQREATLEEMDFILHHINNYPKVSSIGDLHTEIKHSARTISLFHPIILLDAQLLVKHKKKPKSLNYSRVLQYDYRGHVEKWADVVSKDNFQDYVEQITEHYTNHFSKIKARRLV